jgi:hypothetical protein
MDAGLSGVGVGGSRDPRPKKGDRIGIGEQTHLAAPVPMRFFLHSQHNPFIHRCVGPPAGIQYYNFCTKLKWGRRAGTIGSMGGWACKLRHARRPASGPLHAFVDPLRVSRSYDRMYLYCSVGRFAGTLTSRISRTREVRTRPLSGCRNSRLISRPTKPAFSMADPQVDP